MAPTRPALRYYGGKWDLGRWIIGHFPAHQHYVEPCFGAGSVLLQKPAAKLETVNDLNGRIVNYFQVLRDCPDELIRVIDLTPWARSEYETSWQESDDPIEDARRFHIMCWMSIHGGPVPTGFRHQLSIASRYATPATDILRHDLWTVARRLKNVQVLSGDALELIDKLAKYDDPLIYFDPPYPKDTRTHQSGYGDNDQDLGFHVDAAALLRQCHGPVVVSGYACDLYGDLYEAHGWRRVDRSTQANSGAIRVESIWLNPIAAAWRDRSDLPLFTEATP